MDIRLQDTQDYAGGNTRFNKRRRVVVALSGVISIAMAPATLLAQTAKAAKVAAEAKPLAAVNFSGRQRSLAIRAARCYAQLGLGVLPPRSAEVMKIAATEFESSLTRLKVFCAGKRSAKLLEDQAALWTPYSNALREAPAPEAAAPLNEMLERLIPVCSATHDQIILEVGTPLATEVSRSGRQRFLSQRASQLFMFREWRVTRGDYKDIDALTVESRQLRANLRVSTELLIDAKREIDLAETQWIFFDEALRAQLNGRADEISRSNVAKTSERLLEIFDRMTQNIVNKNEA